MTYSALDKRKLEMEVSFIPDILTYLRFWISGVAGLFVLFIGGVFAKYDVVRSLGPTILGYLNKFVAVVALDLVVLGLLFPITLWWRRRMSVNIARDDGVAGDSWPRGFFTLFTAMAGFLSVTIFIVAWFAVTAALSLPTEVHAK
ncbi:MAG: hypothetical protein JO261_05685 [Alphaproteobacteria bacterium]|nr:hypothetical protein [Alphaproteobacteria bacterium]MBV9693172.1 hypothetical protein [Alphaproteobacteria bacterium]